MANAIEDRIIMANKKYGPFASTHEAMGVACEEWDEFRDAIKSNDFEKITEECLDLAAVLIRLARELTVEQELQRRSTK